ncbi:MAG: hypothetical protein KBD64_04035 [Gammaproteobacteria bacterium]|nr:hypothetical protein [Gammaproteobacteria bacterium]
MVVQYRFVTYWEGYPEDDASGKKIRPFPLNEISDQATHVPIAFCAPAKAHPDDPLATTWEFDDSFVYTKAQILAWIAELKTKRGDSQKILLSFQDTPDIHWYPNVDLAAFAKNLAKDIYAYGIDGVDIDAESGMGENKNRKGFIGPRHKDDPYVPTFIKLITLLRTELDSLAVLHPKIPAKIISYTCYTQSDYDKQILAVTKNCIEYLMTMAYWDTLSADIVLFQTYAEMIGDSSKIGIGVACQPSGTDMATVKAVGKWLVLNNYRSMMLWSATRDLDGTYGNTIVEILSPPKNKLQLSLDADVIFAEMETPVYYPKPTWDFLSLQLSLVSAGLKSLCCCDSDDDGYETKNTCKP